MCLSTVYRNTRSPETLMMKNVMQIDCEGSKITLTDLMEHSVTFEGQLLTANLVDSYVVVRADS